MSLLREGELRWRIRVHRSGPPVGAGLSRTRGRVVRRPIDNRRSSWQPTQTHRLTYTSRRRFPPMVRLREYYQDPSAPTGTRPPARRVRRGPQQRRPASAGPSHRRRQLGATRRPDRGRRVRQPDRCPRSRRRVRHHHRAHRARRCLQRPHPCPGRPRRHHPPTARTLLPRRPARLTPTRDQPRPDDIETDAAAWFSTTEIADLKIHPAMRLRIDNALRTPQQSYFE